jgi:hypothetical protein
MAVSNETAQPQRAVRLIFEYDGDDVRLVARQTVDMVVVDTDRTDAPGYYIDARDSSERTLARVAARAAFARSREVFPERENEPIVRTDVQRPRGAFTVTLPAPETADHVTVVRIPAPAEGVTEVRGRDRLASRAIDLASFPLGDISR